MTTNTDNHSSDTETLEPESGKIPVDPEVTQPEESASETPTSNEQNSRPEIFEPNDLEKLTQELEAQNDRYLRLVSEFDNFRKRTNREKESLIKYANEELLMAFMPLMDDLERTIKATEVSEDMPAIKEGIAMIFRKFNHALEKRGVSPIPAIGEVFDTELHEAIASVPAPDPALKGKIVDEVEKGYKYNGKVVRFAKVIIGE